MENWFQEWIQGLNVIILTYSQGSKDLKCIGLTDEFSSQLIKNQLYTEKSNFDFLIKIKFQKSSFIKKCQNMKIVHQEIQKSKLS